MSFSKLKCVAFKFLVEEKETTRGKQSLCYDDDDDDEGRNKPSYKTHFIH